MATPTDVTNANRMPLGASGERGQPKYRAAEQAPVSAPMANDFRPPPSARDAPNGDDRIASIRVSRKALPAVVPQLISPIFMLGPKPSWTLVGSLDAQSERSFRLHAGVQKRR